TTSTPAPATTRSTSAITSATTSSAARAATRSPPTRTTSSAAARRSSARSRLGLMELEGKVAIVTGGAGGIGRALAWKFVEEGARGVVVADLERADPQAVAEELGDRAIAFAGDISDELTVQALIAAAEEAFGPVDLFCANA